MFHAYSNFIKNYSFRDSEKLPKELLIEEAGDLSVYYAPFDHVNLRARVVLCGITPGHQQASIALSEASRQLKKGTSSKQAMIAAKNTASFGGPMRTNLVSMLDYIGLHKNLDIESCHDLFGSKSDLVHYTSALRYPVFKSGNNYSGTPSMVTNSFLRKNIDKFLLPELTLLSPSTVMIPLGPKVEEALRYAAQAGAICEQQILAGMPHPSGANAERIAYFLGRKSREMLSTKTDPEKLDAAKNKLLGQVEQFRLLPTCELSV